MGSVNAFNPNVDVTVQVYDNFYNFFVDVDANEYDVVFSFFRSIFTSDDVAANFTVTLFRIAQGTNTPVLTLLDQLSPTGNQIELTAKLCYYLNGLQNPSTLLGINEPVVPNFYTARNVLP